MISRILLPIIVIFLLALSGSIRHKPAAYQSPYLVIAVTEWRHEGGAQQDIQENTYQRLLQRLEDLPLQNVSLVKIPAVLNSAADVDAIASQFGVDVLVWGWYDEVGVRGYVDLAHAVEDNGMANSLAAFLDNGGSPEAIRVLDTLSKFEYDADGVYFCVPRWTP